MPPPSAGLPPSHRPHPLVICRNDAGCPSAGRIQESTIRTICRTYSRREYHQRTPDKLIQAGTIHQTPQALTELSSERQPEALTAASENQPETLTESHQGNRTPHTLTASNKASRAGTHTADRNGTTPSRSTRPRRCRKLSRYKTIIRNSAGDSHILRYSEPLPESVQMQTDPQYSRRPSRRQSNDARQTTPRKPPTTPTDGRNAYSTPTRRTQRRNAYSIILLYRRDSSGLFHIPINGNAHPAAFLLNLKNRTSGRFFLLNK